MRIVILLVTLASLLASCTSKEKELPSYFCNQNLERYFAGNDSLPVININPNDSFVVIRKSVDSLYYIAKKNSGYPSFRVSIEIDSLYKTVFIETNFLGYYPDGDGPMYCGNTRNILDIKLKNKNLITIEEDSCSINTLRSIVLEHITNYGKNAYLSDNPNVAVINLLWDNKVSKSFYHTIIKEIIDSYIVALEKESHIYFGKKLCKLDSNQLGILKINIPFLFTIGYPETQPYYLQPPPPPPFIEDEFIQE